MLCISPDDQLMRDVISTQAVAMLIHQVLGRGRSHARKAHTYLEADLRIRARTHQLKKAGRGPYPVSLPAKSLANPATSKKGWGPHSTQTDYDDPSFVPPTNQALHFRETTT